jgi:hypothetical protein
MERNVKWIQIVLAWNKKDEKSWDPYQLLFSQLPETNVNLKVEAKREFTNHAYLFL